MSANPVLALVEAQSALFGDLNRVIAVTEEVLRQIPGMGDDEIGQTHSYAKEIGGQAWRIVCACDAEAARRAVARGGKGEYLQQYASEVGCTRQTVYRNAQVHETFFSDEAKSLDTQTFADVLTDGCFYEEALRYRHDPHRALALIAEHKTTNPCYTARDARMDVDNLRHMDKVSILNTQVSDPRQLGRFPVLYIDPPWRYDNGSTTPDRTIERHYPTMSHEELCAFPLASVTQDDAVLFMWATSPKLAEALVVMACWGFDYRSSLVWVKDKIGMGHWFRSRHEYLLLGRRGKFPAPIDDGAQPDSVLHAPRMEHSAKPPEVYDLIERMYPNLPRLELFARNTRAGWVSWGNEIGAVIGGEDGR